MRAVALFRAQLEGCVLDQRAGGRRQLVFLVELTEQFEDLPVVRRQRDTLALGQSLGGVVGPVLQVDQEAVLVQGDCPIANGKRIHSQVLTLS
ncbi:hypothetical protein D9M71_795850 [compost metagenome]